MNTRPITSSPAGATDLPKKEGLASLEGKLIGSRQARLLVPIEANQRIALFLSSMERLLRSTKSTLLVLATASGKPVLQDVWQSARSSADGQRLSTLFPTCYALTLLLDRRTRVSMTTVRALQLQQIEHEEQVAAAFESIVVYDFPASLTPVWKRVLEKQQGSSLLAFCERPTQEVVRWFEDTQREESKEGPAQP